MSFSGPRAIAQGQDIVYVTERCVMRLTPEGLNVVEIAPGVDLERDVLAQSQFPLRVADDVQDDGCRRCFTPSPSASSCSPRWSAPDERACRTSLRGPARAHHAQARRQAQRARPRDDRRRSADAARAIDDTAATRVAILERRGQGVLRGRRHRRLGRAAGARHVARLDAASAIAPSRRWRGCACR